MKFLYINFVVVLWLTALTTFLLGILVLVKNRHNIINKTFALYSFSISWWSFSEIWGIACDKKLTALIWTRIEQVGVFFIPTFFIHFVISLLNIKNKNWLLRIAYSFSIISAILCSTPFMITDSVPMATVPYVKRFGAPGFAYHFAILFFIILITYGLGGLYVGYRGSSGARKNQLKYLFLSTLFGYVGGGANFLLVYGISIPFINPFGTYALPVYIAVVAYAIVKYRLMDITIALTRAGIFAVVYMLVLGVPFGLAGWARPWLMNIFGQGWFWVPMVVLLGFTTAGPFIYTKLRRQAEARLLAEEQRAQQLLTQASEGMMRIRSIKKLVDIVVHVTNKTLKLDNAAMFLLDEETGKYRLEVVRLKSRYRYLDSLDNQDSLIQRLSTVDEPLVYEEVKMQSQELKEKLDEPIHEIERQMQALSAAVIIPASSRGRLLAFLVLGEKRSKRMYSKDDLNTLWALSYQAALAIENARFHQKAQEELLKADREMTSRFIGHGASHQFGNLLNRIIQRSQGKEMDLEELDLNKLPSEDLKKLVLELKEEFHAITNTGMQGKNIVAGILSLGSGSPVDFKQEDITIIINRIVQAINLKQSKQAIQDMASITEIITNIPDNLPKIFCNSLQLEQVLDNMSDNGLEAIEEKQNLIKQGELKEENFRGRIIIEAGQTQEHIYLKISDNGIGMKPENLKKIFSPFFSTKATERLSRKGHGIGMHMVKEIMKAHQGKIYIDKTEYGKGTTFVIELPLKVSENKKI